MTFTVVLKLVKSCGGVFIANSLRGSPKATFRNGRAREFAYNTLTATSQLAGPWLFVDLEWLGRLYYVHCACTYKYKYKLYCPKLVTG